MKDEIYFRMKRMLGWSGGDHPRAAGWHVSDLATSCARRSWYREEISPTPTEPSMSLVLGSMIHAKLEDAGRAIYDDSIYEHTMMYDVAADKIVSEPNDTTVTGTCDAIYMIGDEAYLVDYKTRFYKGYPPRSPNVEHVNQLNYYRVMIEADDRIHTKPKKAYVGYIDTSERMENIDVLEAKLYPQKQIKTMMQAKIAELNASQIPPRPTPIPKWLCNKYCDYAVQCGVDGP